MTRPLAILSLVVLALALCNAALEHARARERAENERVGTLFSPTEAEELRKQPALSIELAGESHLYGRVEGEWRCLSYHRAPADGRSIQALIDTLARAEGLVHTSAVDEAPAYGINTPETIRVSILGPRALENPSGDLRAGFDVGKSVAGRDAAFVRRKGTPDVWAIDGDPRAAIERRLAPGLPPLLHPGVVTERMSEASGGLVRVRVTRGDGPGGGQGFVLERRDRPPEELAPGALPWTWFLDPGPGERELPEETAGAYASFLERAPYLEVLDPSRRETLVLEPPAARVVLEGRTGGALVLDFGQALADGTGGRVPLWVPASGTLYLVAPRTLELCAPDPELFAVADEASNPWSTALRGEPTEER